MTGIERIAAERRRQIEKEGWTPEHDDEHHEGDLAAAAVCYAAPERVFVQRVYGDEVAFADPWPGTWDRHWDKRPYHGNVLKKPTPTQRIRMLEKAGALIAAEIDRLLRAAEQPKAEKEVDRGA